jgi:hypothetical protein
VLHGCLATLRIIYGPNLGIWYQAVAPIPLGMVGNPWGESDVTTFDQTLSIADVY